MQYKLTRKGTAYHPGCTMESCQPHAQLYTIRLGTLIRPSSRVGTHLHDPTPIFGGPHSNHTAIHPLGLEQLILIDTHPHRSTAHTHTVHTLHSREHLYMCTHIHKHTVNGRQLYINQVYMDSKWDTDLQSPTVLNTHTKWSPSSIIVNRTEQFH